MSAARSRDTSDAQPGLSGPFPGTPNHEQVTRTESELGLLDHREALRLAAPDGDGRVRQLRLAVDAALSLLSKLPVETLPIRFEHDEIVLLAAAHTTAAVHHAAAGREPTAETYRRNALDLLNDNGVIHD